MLLSLAPVHEKASRRFSIRANMGKRIYFFVMRYIRTYITNDKRT